MKIYTKTGDDGTTGLFGGRRVPKDALRIESYGTVDELNSVIGVVRCYGTDKTVDAMLEAIQNDLFDLGADLAAPLDVQNARVVRIDAADVTRLEQWIDRTEEQLPALTNFILPGGSKEAAYLHVARNVCRRAERLVVALAREESITSHVLIYLNRLSDLLFVLARDANRRAKVAETTWKSKPAT